MGRAYILIMLVCSVVGFAYFNFQTKPETDLESNLYAIGLGAAWIGGLYALSGVTIGWHFVRCLDKTRSKTNAFLVATPVHIASTMVAAYVVPTLVYLTTHWADAWIATAFLSFFLGVPQFFVDFFLLNWLFRMRLEPKQLGILWLWKTTTVMVFMFLIFSMPSIVTLADAAASCLRIPMKGNVCDKAL